jgi:hypothetical protein
MQNKH